MVGDSMISDEMRRAIGTWRLPDFPPEDVTIWAILRYVAASEDPNPLWRDEGYAKRTRWGGIIAPPTFVEIFSPVNRAFREQPGEPSQELPFKMPFERTLLAGEDYEFFDPIRPGDAISCKGVLGDISERESSATGKMVFVRTDKEYRNQRDELVARTTFTTMSIERAPAAAATATGAPATPVPERAVAPAKISPEQVYFEDVEIGMPIPPMEKRVTVITIARWSGAVGEASRPWFDHEYMTKVFGLPNVVAPGPLNAAYLAQLITNWIGGRGVLKKHSVQYRGNVFPKDILTLRGKVARKWVERGENFVECETWAENQHAMRVTPGKSIVTLPAMGHVVGR